MKKTTKLLSVFFAMVLCISSMCSMVSFAEDKAPVEVTVKAEKESYSKGDTLKFDVSVSNNNPFGIDLVSLEASLPEKYEFTENGKAELKLAANETQKYTISAKNTDTKGTDSPKTGVYPPVIFMVLLGLAGIAAFKTGKGRKMFSFMLTAVLLSSVAVQGYGSYTNAAEKLSELTAKADFKYNSTAGTITIKAQFDNRFISIDDKGNITVTPLIVNTDGLEERDDGSYKTTDSFSGLSGFLGLDKEKTAFTCNVYDRNGELVKTSEITPDSEWKLEDAGLAEGYNKAVLSAVSEEKKYDRELVIFVPQTLDYNKQALRDVTGVSNARQLGGYINTEGRAVKQNVLLRTGNLAHITDAGVQALQEKYNVSDIIDLRYDKELNKNTMDREIEGIEHHNIPMSATKDKATEVFSQNPDLYAKMQELQKNAGKPGGSTALGIFQAEVGVISVDAHIKYFESDEAVGYYRDTFDIFLNKPEDKAVLFHCAGGKDRTGMISMLMLAALDFDKDIMMQDYLMTNTANASKIEETRKAAEEYTDDPELQYNIIYTAAVYPEVMETNIDDLTAQYGSVKNFLREKVGLTDEDFAKLKELYLED